MTRWFKRLFFTVLVLVVGYVLVVQVLRWIAYGEEEQAAVALMRELPPPPSGENGFKYLAYAGKDAPDEALEAALAEDVAAFEAYHAAYAAYLGRGADTALEPEPPATPGADRLPDHEEAQLPEFACSFSQQDCPGRLAGHEAAARAWLAADAPRLRRVERALASAYLTNPFALNPAAPSPKYPLLRLPVNDIALQALEGDVGGALPRACGLLADARKHLRNHGQLVDKVVFASLVEGASDLLLRLRTIDPAAPLGPRCDEALAPLAEEEFQVCNALRGEFAMMSEFSRMTEQANVTWRTPLRWGLVNERLQDGWTATALAPFCTAEGQAAIARGEIPRVDVQEFDRSSIDFWAAPISHTLTSLSLPAYGGYQQRLLDHAAAFKANLEAIARVEATEPAPSPEN